MGALEQESNRLIWVVISLGLATAIGIIVYGYMTGNLTTWISGIGTAFDKVSTSTTLTP